MATFRSRLVLALLAFLGLACVTRETAAAPEAAPVAAAPVEEAKIQKDRIEHVTPRRDFVGPLPTRLEWTAVEGADSYAVSVENEIEIAVFDQAGITATSTPWPAGLRIEPGTYFWRIVGMKAGRMIADSGRAAFVVRDE